MKAWVKAWVKVWVKAWVEVWVKACVKAWVKAFAGAGPPVHSGHCQAPDSDATDQHDDPRSSLVTSPPLSQHQRLNPPTPERRHVCIETLPTPVTTESTPHPMEGMCVSKQEVHSCLASSEALGTLDGPETIKQQRHTVKPVQHGSNRFKPVQHGSTRSSEGGRVRPGSAPRPPPQGRS